MKALTLTFVMIGFFVSHAQAMDKELAIKVIQNAITTIIMDKQSSEVADGVLSTFIKYSLHPLEHGLSERRASVMQIGIQERLNATDTI